MSLSLALCIALLYGLYTAPRVEAVGGQDPGERLGGRQRLPSPPDQPSATLIVRRFPVRGE